MQKTSKRIGEILLELEFITEAQLNDALQEQKIGYEFLGRILIKQGSITEANLMEALSVQFNIPMVDTSNQHIDMVLVKSFSSSLILDHKCFPLYKDEDKITVAIVNPLNAVAISKLEEEARPRRLSLVLTSQTQMQALINDYRKSISDSIRKLLNKGKDKG